MTRYLLGQGKWYTAKRDAAGNPKALRWLLDTSAAKIALKTSTVKQTESYSGQRGTVKNITVAKDCTIELTLQELSKENLSLALFGKAQTVASGSVTGEVLPADLVAGDRVALKFPKVSNLVLTDSATPPAPIDAAKYKLDPAYGAIVLNDITGITQPIKAAYKHDPVEQVSIFSSIPEDIFLRYEGINLAEDGAPIIVELYRVKTEPLKELALISDNKVADMNISGSVLIDTTKSPEDDLGQFGRIVQTQTA